VKQRATDKMTISAAQVHSLALTEPDPVQRQESASLSQSAYRTLRQEVVSGVLRPNERLIEVELSERLGMSRTPVRDGLMRLTVDGLVDSGKRGWTVHEHTRGELLAIYETRAALEGYAAHLSALRATAEELDKIESALEFQSVELDPANSDLIARRNSDFHSAVVRSCHNPRLVELVEGNAEFYFNYRIASIYTPDELRESLDGHARLFAALRARDSDVAERVLRAHLMQSVTLLLDKGYL
jgi:DNA-binding GntR family transcriptional regulator